MSILKVSAIYREIVRKFEGFKLSGSMLLWMKSIDHLTNSRMSFSRSDGHALPFVASLTSKEI